MKLTYDPRHNVAYLKFADGPGEVETLRISDEVNLDIAPDGTVYGIELLNANTQLSGSEGDRLVLLNEATGRQVELPLGSQ